MTTALQELANPRFLAVQLSDFYQRTNKKKRSVSGIDGISLEKIGRKNSDYIDRLSKEILGKPISKNTIAPYQHQDLTVSPIEKPEGKGYRIICIPTVKDRLIQKALLQLFENKKLKIGTEISYGDRKNRGVRKAINHAIKQRNERPWVYKTDITQFFDQIDRALIKNKVKQKIKLRSLHQIIFQAIDADIGSSAASKYSTILKTCGIKRGIGLRQGLPLSPLLASLYLESFDKAIYKSPFQAVRYADDLIVFCSTKQECIDAHNFCVKHLKPLGLTIPNLGTRKSVIYEPNKGAEFLGLSIEKGDNDKYKLMISDSQISKVQNKFEEYCDIKKNLHKGWQFSNLISRLESLVHSYKGHFGEAENYEQFENNLKKWKQMVYAKILRDQLNIDLGRLDFDQKLFFHLIDTKISK